MNGLLGDPQRLSMLLSGLGLLTSKYEDQADRWKAFGANGLLKGARDRQDSANKARKIIKGADGYNYYTDTQERVLPSITAPATPELDTKDLLKYQEGVRKEITPIAEQLNTMKGSFDSLVESAQADASSRGAADQSMIFSFAKMLDPRSVVRTEEGQAIARTDGYFGQLQGFLNQIKGQGQLTTKARKGLIEEAYRQLKTKSSPLTDRVDWYKNSVIGSSFDPAIAISPGLLNYRDWVESYKLPTYYGPELIDPKKPEAKTPERNPIKAESLLDRWFK